MAKIRPKYLLIAKSSLVAKKIEDVYEKSKLFANFDLDVAFSGVNIVMPNNNFIIIDPCRREIKDHPMRYRWYMPKGAKVEVDTQYNMMPAAKERLRNLARNDYDAVINACGVGPTEIAEFWYMLDEVGMKPTKVKNLPIGNMLDDDVIKMLLLTLNNKN